MANLILNYGKLLPIERFYKNGNINYLPMNDRCDLQKKKRDDDSLKVIIFSL